MQQTILVTGSSSGFGRLTVEALARRGHTVFAAMRSMDDRNAACSSQLRELAGALSGTIEPLEMDVTDDIPFATLPSSLKVWLLDQAKMSV